MTDIPADILQQVKDIEGCLGIVFTGSHQQGTATASSDWDFYVLLAPEFKSFRKTWEYNDTYIEVFCNTLESINKNELVTNKISNAAIRILATGTIILDTDNILDRVQKRALELYKSGPPAPSKEDMMVMGYTLKTYIDDLDSLTELGTPGYFLQESALQYAVECLYKLNCKWMVKPRDIESDMLEIFPEWGQGYVDIHATTNNQHRVNGIKLLIEKLSTKYTIPITGQIMQYRDKK